MILRRHHLLGARGAYLLRLARYLGVVRPESIRSRAALEDVVHAALRGQR